MNDISSEQSKLKDDALDFFGRLLIKHVRDITIRKCDSAIKEGRKPFGTRGFDEIASLNPQQLEVIYHLIPDVIDRTLHYLLWSVFQDTKEVDIVVHTESGDVPSLREVAIDRFDGLHNALYGPDGWIKLYSEERVSPDKIE